MGYPKDYFEAISNQTAFLTAIAKQYHLKTSHDWKRVSTNLIYKKGGKVIISSYHA